MTLLLLLVFWVKCLEMLDTYTPDIVIGCETSSIYLDNNIIPNNYKLCQKDCDDWYGGVLIGISTTLSSKPVDIETLCDFCVICMHLSHSQELIIHVLGAYRPPSI